MTITQHPTDLSLAAYTAGHLDEGRSVVVEAHAAVCAHCRRWIARLAQVGGILLTDGEPVAMSATSLPHALARIETKLTRGSPGVLAQAQNDAQLLPKAVQAYSVGAWRWMGPGVSFRPIHVPAEGGARVFLLKASPGTRMPHHTHSGSELTLVLRGAFSHVGGRYGPGDLDDADDSVEHQPIVESGEDCVCLVAMEGNLRLLGPWSRILQPFVRL